MQPQQRPDPLPKAVRNGDHAVEAFNPLLRSLLTWELVERVELPDGSHQWELTASTQQRLDELTRFPRRAVTSLVYLDHWCAGCRQQRLTHLVESRYLCEACQLAESDTSAATTPKTPATAGHRPGLLRRNR